MSWLKRLFGEQHSGQVQEHTGKIDAPVNKSMSPGLTGGYDLDLREKAAMHEPPTAPAHMGFEGEYDANGLAKRVAAALDQEPGLDDIETLSISQRDSTVVFTGSVPNSEMLQRIHKIACAIDGAKRVDTTEVRIGVGDSQG